MTRNSSKKRIAAVFLTAVIAIAAVTPIAADTDWDAKIREYEERAEQLEQQGEEIQAEINNYRSDIQETDRLRELVSQQIDGINAKVENQNLLIAAKEIDIADQYAAIAELEQRMDETQRKIDECQRQIQLLNQENTDNLAQFGKILRGMYISGDVDMVELLAESEDFFDMLVRAQLMQNIGDQNIAFMNGLLADIDAQNTLIADLETYKSNLAEDKARQETEKHRLEEDLADLEAQNALFEADLAAEFDNLSSVEQQLNELEYTVESLKIEYSEVAREAESTNYMIAETIKKQQAEEAAKNRPVYSSEGFAWPLDAQYQMVTCSFGWDAAWGRNHYGTDIGNAGIGGANIYAAQSGTVITAYNDGGWHGGYGNYIVIDHGGGLSTLYAHTVTGSVVVTAGQTVEKGQLIAKVGTTGRSTGNHLHFEVRVDGVARDAMGYSYEGR
jgi:murein DD-endopeptidase MepM/ murein hydrolase activator NlpD